MIFRPPKFFSQPKGFNPSQQRGHHLSVHQMVCQTTLNYIFCRCPKIVLELFLAPLWNGCLRLKFKLKEGDMISRQACLVATELPTTMSVEFTALTFAAACFPWRMEKAFSKQPSVPQHL